MTERRLLSSDAFRAAVRDGKTPSAGVARVQSGAVRAFDDSRRAVRFCFSDGSVDRVGDTIAATGWRLEAFLKNPVALWAHLSTEPPIGRASNLAIENGKLMGDIEFMSADLYPFADLIYRMVREKYLNAVSVGFVPIEYSWAKDDERKYGLDFEEQELLEISVVPIPANSNALAEARSKGLISRGELRRFERSATKYKATAPAAASVPRVAAPAPTPQFGPMIERVTAERREAARRVIDHKIDAALLTADTSTREGRAWLAARLRHLRHIQQLWH